MAGALIGALRVSLSAETSAFEAGMKRSQRTAQTTASKIKSSFGSIRGEFGLLKAGLAGFIGALSVGSIIAAGKAALDYAGSLGEIAQQLGVTTRDLQVFRYAAGQAGVSQSEMEKGLARLTKSMGDAQVGSKTMIAAFNAIGISVDEIRGKDAGEVFRLMADGLAKIPDPAQRAAVETAIFGRAGQKLDTLLAGGSGAINELAAAAEELGIVLSDAQIQKADETADKLEALQTVLKAQIAGVVADNADAILDLANAIAQVASEAGQAIGKIRAFYQEARIAANEAENALSRRFDAGLLGRLGIGNEARARNRAANDADTRRIREQQADARFSALFRGRPKTTRTGGNVSQFLASGGGKGRKATKDRSAEEAQRKAEKALRENNQFDQEIRRAKIDVLQATRDLATDAVERYQISIDIKDAERAAFESQLQYEVAAGERTQVQADQLQLEYDRKDQLERDKLIAEEQARAREESNRLDDLQFDLERDRLQSESQLAETASEQRDVQLRLLDLAYRQERARLTAILADEQSSDLAKEEARRRLANLNKTYGNDRAGVMAGSRGPLEAYYNSLPVTDAKMNEALQNVAVRGLQSLEDGLMSIIDGTESVSEAFRKMAMSILSDLIRINIQRLLIAPLAQGLMGVLGGGAGAASSGFGGLGALSALGSAGSADAVASGVLFGFAGGGGFNVTGRPGTDNNVMSINGLPIAKVSYGERVSISNDNGRTPRGGNPISVNAPITIHGNASRETVLQMESGIRRAVARASRVNS